MTALPLPAKLRRSIPGPVRDLALRGLSLWYYDIGVVEVPSERAKRRHLLRLFRQRGHDVFVESGTYLGDTVGFFVPHARHIVSIEIDEELWRRATARFRAQAHVEIVRGDAELEIPRVLADLGGGPCLMWLDGHYSGAGTGRGERSEPSLAILDRLARTGLAPGSTVVIDDLRLFGRQPEFPSLESLTATARGAWPQAGLYTGLDSLIIALR